MIPTDPQAQAALIMATGKLLRDRTLRLQSAPSVQPPNKAPFGQLSMAQSLAMMAVKDHGPLSITSLAALLAVSAPSASAMVERLVERRILMREPDPKDRRKVKVRLSPQADAAYDQIHHFILQDFIRIVECLGPDTTRKWCEVMVQLRHVLLEGPIPTRTPAAARTRAGQGAVR